MVGKRLLGEPEATESGTSDQRAVMARIRDLSKAPITEAVIDLRATLPEGFDPGEFSGLRSALSHRYPDVEEHRLFRQKIELGADGKQHSREDRGLQGFFFRSEDHLDLAQFRIDGLTFNRLKPYTNWEDVLAKAREVWSLYCQIACPDVVTRIAVRYINHLKIERQISRISDYLTSPPPIPPEAPGSMSSFITKVVVLDAEEGIAANVIQALEKDVESQFPTIILDIDVYKTRDFGSQDEEVWLTFGALRELKNRIFFGSVTETTVELFE